MKSKIEGKSLILLPETDLIASKIEEIRDFFQESLKDNKNINEVILDADNIEIVDSLGVNLVIGLYKQVAEDSKKFKVINAGKKFIKLANFFRFPSIFTIEEKG